MEKFIGCNENQLCGKSPQPESIDQVILETVVTNLEAGVQLIEKQEHALAKFGGRLSEVALALDAAAQLQRADIRATVVSLPCWEIFETQSPAQRAAILGTGPKIGIEAAVRFGWDQILAPEDPFIGMTGFGASAPADRLYEEFGITAQAVARKVKSLI